MTRYSLLIILLCLNIISQAQKLTVYDLSCEHKINPIGIEDTKPRLSWKINSPARNTMQTAYHIRVGSSADFKKGTVIWESGKIISDQSILQPYGGPAITSGKRYYWQVKVWDNKKQESTWSPPAFWEMGLLNKSDWKAQWIEPVQDTARKTPALMLRKDFKVSKAIANARVYVTSHGFYELSLNGKKVGDQVLTPGWTSYQKRLQYQVYDITKLLQPGSNAVGALLGDGWYRGTLGWIDNWAVWGKKLALLSQIHLQYTDGSEEFVVSDGTWVSNNDSPIIENGIYDGESYDARKEVEGWNTAGYNAASWKTVTVVDYGTDELVAMETVPVKKIMELKPIKIFRTPKGTLVADMGQNMVGWIRLKVKGSGGTTVKIRHAEVLDKFGEFYIDNLRSAKAEMLYTLKGGGEEIYEPRFTFFGFRYIAIEGYPGELKPENVIGVVIHSDMKVTGTFECSNPLINQLQSNIQWGQRGNFVDVPTDCPQRDERLGWTGDAQAFCRTAAYNMDVAAFFSKWLKDLGADQYPDGQVPFVVPDVLKNNSGTSAGWGDVVTIAPWTLYHVYGDKKFLESNFNAMKAYVDYIRTKAGDRYVWKGGSVFGDWLYYKPQMEKHGEPDGHTSPDMIATMFYAYSANLLSMTAMELGKTQEATFYKDIFNKVKAAFNEQYVTPAGRIASDSQTAYVLALKFGLLTPELQTKATEHLVNDIKRRGNHLSTGFLGTPYLCHVLSDHGKTNVAYDLLLQEKFPSWLFPVKMGATTIWERWDGQKPDSTFQDVGMNSFNHYAYGAIGDWMYQVVAGLELGKPGYKEILIQPKPDKRLTFANASFESPYGKIKSGWKIDKDQVIVSVSIPANTTARITLPGVKAGKVSENKTPIQGKSDFKNIQAVNDDLTVEVGSGQYDFSYTFSNQF